MGGSADAAGEEDDPGLLPGHGKAACASLVSCQIALAESAETAQVAEGHIERLVSVEKLPVPFSEGADTREGSWTQKLLPIIVIDPPNLDL
jgi:hypothetical protein